jgi:hypothetical protein
MAAAMGCTHEMAKVLADDIWFCIGHKPQPKGRKPGWYKQFERKNLEDTRRILKGMVVEEFGVLEVNSKPDHLHGQSMVHGEQCCLLSAGVGQV